MSNDARAEWMKNWLEEREREEKRTAARHEWYKSLAEGQPPPQKPADPDDTVRDPAC